MYWAIIWSENGIFVDVYRPRCTGPSFGQIMAFFLKKIGASVHWTIIWSDNGIFLEEDRGIGTLDHHLVR